MAKVTGDGRDYKNLDSNFISFRVGKRENSILHCLLSLGVNQDEYSIVRVKHELAKMTNLPENECSRLLSYLKKKNIINTMYLRQKHELNIILLPRVGWNENIEIHEKKQYVSAEPKSECSNGTKSPSAYNIEFIDLIINAVEKYSRGKNPKLLVAEIDEILHKLKKI
jgi:hypothetical protein